MHSPLLITGASGRIGSLVARRLTCEGAPVRLATRRPPGLEGAEHTALDLTDPATWDDAFRDVRTMFLIRPPHVSNIARDLLPSLTRARELGVRHVVFLSLQGAESATVVPHAKVETWLRGSGLDWTFVRPSFFMENLSTTHTRDIRDDDIIMVPAGRGRTSFVSAQDVADIAAAALLEPGAHAGRAWTPTGSEALTYGEVADILTETLGRPITYARPGAIRYALHARRTLAMDWEMVGVTTAIYSVARLGKADGITDDVQRVLGRAPQRFDTWAREHAAVWHAPGSGLSDQA